MLNIRHATQDDRDAIIAVHIAAVRAIDSHYSKEEIEAFAIPKDPASYEEAIRDKEFYVAENDDQIVFLQSSINRNPKLRQFFRTRQEGVCELVRR
jgi:hypothetical protein